MSTQTRLMTADEFLEMPDDGLLHELVRGEVVAMSLPGGRHGRVTLKIGRLVGNHVEDRHLGDTYRRRNRLPDRARSGHGPRPRRGIRA